MGRAEGLNVDEIHSNNGHTRATKMVKSVIYRGNICLAVVKLQRGIFRFNCAKYKNQHISMVLDYNL